MIFLMSATANTILSFLIGVVMGAVGIAIWYAHESYKEYERWHN